MLRVKKLNTPLFCLEKTVDRSRVLLCDTTFAPSGDYMNGKAKRRVRHAHESQRGYSLAELIMVIVIIMVVSLMPIMMISSTKDRFSRQTFVRELKSALERARFDSVKRRPEMKEQMAKVVVSNDSFQLVTYANRIGTVDSTGVAQVAQTQTKNINPPDAAITAHASSGLSSSSFPVTITFDSRGEITTTDANGSTVINPVFVICQGECSSHTAENSNIILVSPTGTVNLLPGDSSIPTFVSPSTTGGVSAGSSINKMVTILNN